jgi:hypothetical protein
MATSVDWGSVPLSGNGGSRFRKFVPGANKIRFVTNPCQYEKTWAAGEKPSTRYVAFVLDLDDNAAVKLLDFPPSVAGQLRTWGNDNGLSPSAADSHAFCINVSGDGKARRYLVQASARPYPIPPTVDVEKLRIELQQMEFGDDKPKAKTDAFGAFAVA